MKRKQIPAEALINLRRRLDLLPARCSERRLLVAEMAKLYGVSRHTLYRSLRERARPKAIRRADNGWQMDVQYEVRRPLVFNLDVVGKFHAKQMLTRGGDGV